LKEVGELTTHHSFAALVSLLYLGDTIMQRLFVLPVLLITLLVGNLAFSADYQKGLDAFLDFDFATALREWEPLAKQGDAEAQNSLGSMYYAGFEVTQNYQTAVKWYWSAPIEWSNMNVSA